MKYIKYDDKPTINLEQITSVLILDELTSKSPNFKIIFIQNTNHLEWNFYKNKEERDTVHKNILNYIEPINMKKRIKI